MRLWGYYALHTFWNSVKKIFRSTTLIIILAVVGFIVICGFAGGLIGIAIADHEDATEASSEYATEVLSDTEEEEEVSEEDEEMTPEDIAKVKTCVEAGVALILVVVMLWGLYAGSKSGADIFQMADVNFLFTAPMKPQSVLLFRLSFQMMAAFVASLYLVFQIPNLVINAGLGVPAVVAMFAGYIMLLIFQRLMMVFSYTFFTTYQHLKKYVLPFVIGIVLLLAGAVTAVFFAVDQDIFRTVEVTFGSRALRLVPLIGWYKGMIMCAVNGQILMFFVYLLLLLAGVAGMVFLIWHIKADFYEDAFSAASRTAAMVADAQEGRAAAKKRSEKIKRDGDMKGWGASTFLTKEILCRKRMAKFGVVTNTMLFYLAAGIGLGLITSRAMSSHSFMLTGCVILGIMFFRNLGNPIAQETSMNWLYLVPDNPYKKVFYAMLSGTYSCGVDMLPGLLAAFLLTEAAPGMVVLWYVTLVIVDFMLSAVGLVLEVLFPASALDLVKSMIQMILRLGMILVLAGLVAAGYALGGELAAVVLTLVVSGILGGICFIIYPSVMHNGKE